MRSLHGEFVGRGHERQARQLGDLGRSRLSEARRRIDSGAHCRAAERKAIDAPQGIFDPIEIVCQHAFVARPFLSERERCGVLHVACGRS